MMSNMRTISGEYYVGMSKEIAEKNDLFKKTIGIDFFDIDKNSDGILDEEEIIAAREKESIRNNIKIIGKTLLSGTILFLACTPGIGTCLQGVSLLGKFLGVSGLVWSCSDMHNNTKEEERTQQLSKNLNILN